MKLIKKVFWTSSLLIPATVVPLTTATGCSQVWGYKTPISIGTNISGGTLDPFKNFRNSSEQLYDLNGDSVVSYLQSNYAIDVAHNGFYGYSLPQKWNSETKSEEPTSQKEGGGKIDWKGAFETANIGWYLYTDSAFVNTASKNGVWKDTAGTKTQNVVETVSSYKNNIQSTNIELVSLIATTLSQYFSYALHYQGTQIDDKWTAETETDSNLGIAWGGNLTHGAKSSDGNRKLYESVFATNAVSGTGKSDAAIRPTHVEFNFVDLPIVTYAKGSDNKIIGVSDATKKLLNGTNARPKDCSVSYWSARTDEQTETINNFRTDKKEEYKYRIYTYTNVPVVVKFNGFAKSFVNPRISSGYLVSDFYSGDDTIINTVGDSWTSLNNFTDGGIAPKFSSYQFKSQDAGKIIDPIHKDQDKMDMRLYSGDKSRLTQDEFVVLLNFAYKEYESGKIGETTVTEAELAKLDRVTMSGLNSIFPAYILDKNLALNEETFFKLAHGEIKEAPTAGYIINNDITNKYVNNFLNLVKRSSSEGMKPFAKELTEESKKLLKFLAYMLGNNSLAVNANDCIDITEIKALSVTATSSVENAVTFAKLPARVKPNTEIKGTYTIKTGYQYDKDNSYVEVNGTKLTDGYSLDDGTIQIDANKVTGNVKIYIAVKAI